MKRCVMLFTFTAIAIAAIYAAGAVYRRSFSQVKTVKVNISTAENTVVCTGKVELSGAARVIAPKTGIVRKLYVSKGDSVTAGQILMTIGSVSDTASGTASQVSGLYAAYLYGYGSQPSSEANRKSEDSSVSVFTVRAGIAGVIESISFSGEGSYVTAGDTVITIRSDSGVQVRLSVDETQISGVKEGQQVEITGAGFRDSVYHGAISSISSEAKQLISASGQETVVEAVARVDHPGADIKPGLTAKVKISESTGSNLLIVPYEAIQEDNSSREFVFVVSGNRAQKVFVTTGREYDGGMEITEGLAEGDEIILDSEEIRDGEKILAEPCGEDKNSD